MRYEVRDPKSDVKDPESEVRGMRADYRLPGKVEDILNFIREY